MGTSKTTSRIFKALDLVLGRGSYRTLKRWLDPASEYTQIIYGRVLDDVLDRSVRWLDAGCGHDILEYGAGTEQFDLASKAQMVVGCDLDVRSLKQARQVKYRVCGNLEKLPFRPGSFAVVSLNNVAEHLTDPSKTFAEVARVLKKHGRLIIHTPNARSYVVWVARLARLLLPEPIVFRLIKFIEHREEDDVFPTLYRANTKQRLIELASVSGLAAERVSLLRCRPLFYFVAPVALAELLFSRALLLLGLEEFAAPVLLAVFRSAGAGSELVPEKGEIVSDDIVSSRR
jgi:SAM-dependent methyltransferase